MKIDIHSHQKNKSEFALIDNIHFVGIHPWFIDIHHYKNDLQELKIKYKDNRPRLVGETGLDRLKSKVPFEIQLEVFHAHIDLALMYDLPLVIHCLKAHADFIQILKTIKKFPRAIIHDFSGSEVELKKYLNYDFYFSFGRSLYRENSKAQMVFQKVPENRLFLETDDSLEFSIEMIYQKASDLRPELDFENLIEKNFLTFFNYSNNISATDFIKNLTKVT